MINKIKSFYNYLLNPNTKIRKEDMVLGTFPKSGTTWFRFIYANIIALEEKELKLETPVDFNTVNYVLQAGIDSLAIPQITPDKHPLLRHTHKKYSFIFNSTKIKVYIYRNPNDIMVSYYEYFKTLKNYNNITFKEFIRSDTTGIPYWCKHINSWHKKAYFIAYEDMKSNTYETIANLLRHFNLSFSDENLQQAIDFSSFRNMKEIEKKHGIDKQNLSRHKNKNINFVRKGVVGGWQDYFDKDDLSYVKDTLENYNILNKNFSENFRIELDKMIINRWL